MPSVMQRIGTPNARHNRDAKYRAKLENVDHELTQYNQALRTVPIEKLYEDHLQPAFDAYNKSQKRQDRRKDIVKLPDGKQVTRTALEYQRQLDLDARTKSKNKIDQKGRPPIREIIWQFGNPEQGYGCAGQTPEQRRIIGEMLWECQQEAERRYPQLVWGDATLHCDEVSKDAEGEICGSIHLHSSFVPLCMKNKQGPAVQVAFERCLREMGFSTFEAWKHDLDDIMEKVLQSHNLERVVMHNDKDHVDSNDFHRQQKLKAQTKELEKQRDAALDEAAAAERAAMEARERAAIEKAAADAAAKRAARETAAAQAAAAQAAQEQTAADAAAAQAARERQEAEKVRAQLLTIQQDTSAAMQKVRQVEGQLDELQLDYQEQRKLYDELAHMNQELGIPELNDALDKMEGVVKEVEQLPAGITGNRKVSPGLFERVASALKAVWDLVANLVRKLNAALDEVEHYKPFEQKYEEANKDRNTWKDRYFQAATERSKLDNHAKALQGEVARQRQFMSQVKLKDGGSVLDAYDAAEAAKSRQVARDRGRER